MTLVQMQPRSPHVDIVGRTVDDAMEAAGPQVCDDMTVEVALAVTAGSRTDHLLVCDEDGLCTGLITRTRLSAIRDSSAYTDRLRLRDVLGHGQPFASPTTAMAEAEHAMRYRNVAALAVVDEQGSALGVLALAR
ncbi:CBS domain-containing protein [Streptomyces sp. NBC_01264]|uniref:CBS domain-containing protein n=1 Tax=Streptomyces sp. NBC_01264 TaxID=2903804 RepID=UPI00224D44F2|nr:CBS domain-containing protein [Streptomyces sp. NBC_01264]MCX4779879.1 CBS domain-containing protein [Streptomyces sp. NBC_01264]MCX4783085.1 CBS domain-containing protein [Streptomyces sp. NBC_01264]